jgi:hypothetical protein
MDKRWKNLSLIIVIIAILILAYLFFTGAGKNLLPVDEKTARINSYLTYLKANDVNYGELKVALEFFDETLPQDKLDRMYANAPDDYIKGLISLEKRENAFAEEVDRLSSEKTIDLCAEIDSADNLRIDSFSIVFDLYSLTEHDNYLQINPGVLEGNADQVTSLLDEDIKLCADIGAEAVLNGS